MQCSMCRLVLYRNSTESGKRIQRPVFPVSYTHLDVYKRQGLDSIRDCIAFPKNNSGRDVMLDAPSVIDQKQLDELNLIVEVKE